MRLLCRGRHVGAKRVVGRLLNQPGACGRDRQARLLALIRGCNRRHGQEGLVRLLEVIIWAAGACVPLGGLMWAE